MSQSSFFSTDPYNFSGLPEDMQREIIQRLPIKSLISMWLLDKASQKLIEADSVLLLELGVDSFAEFVKGVMSLVNREKELRDAINLIKHVTGGWFANDVFSTDIKNEAGEKMADLDIPDEICKIEEYLEAVLTREIHLSTVGILQKKPADRVKLLLTENLQMFTSHGISVADIEKLVKNDYLVIAVAEQLITLNECLDVYDAINKGIGGEDIFDLLLSNKQGLQLLRDGLITIHEAIPLSKRDLNKLIERRLISDSNFTDEKLLSKLQTLPWPVMKMVIDNNLPLKKAEECIKQLESLPNSDRALFLRLSSEDYLTLFFANPENFITTLRDLAKQEHEAAIDIAKHFVIDMGANEIDSPDEKLLSRLQTLPWPVMKMVMNDNLTLEQAEEGVKQMESLPSSDRALFLILGSEKLLKLFSAKPENFITTLRDLAKQEHEQAIEMAKHFVRETSIDEIVQPNKPKHS